MLLIFCPFSAGLDYSITSNTSKYLNFTGDSVHSVSIQIIDDGISEPSETFVGLLSSADGTTIPPNIHLEPTRATATILNNNGSYNSYILYTQKFSPGENFCQFCHLLLLAKFFVLY